MANRRHRKNRSPWPPKLLTNDLDITHSPCKKIVTNLHSGQKKTKALSCKFRNKFLPLQARWETYIITMTKIEQGQKVRLFAFFLAFLVFSLFVTKK